MSCALPLPFVDTAFAAKMRPLPCAYTAFAATSKTPPSPWVDTAFAAKMPSFALPTLPSRLSHCLCLVCSTAFAAKTPPSRLRCRLFPCACTAFAAESLRLSLAVARSRSTRWTRTRLTVSAQQRVLSLHLTASPRALLLVSFHLYLTKRTKAVATLPFTAARLELLPLIVALCCYCRAIPLDNPYCSCKLTRAMAERVVFTACTHGKAILWNIYTGQVHGLQLQSLWRIPTAAVS